ncbi:hypothetical protein BGZ95_009321 [Linnemannia exigua]|uniref:Uncharacterized protein n=1 Tax=Linnemannia exigua TaxID=604196 RepID=A0AAD4H7Y8_9FUNG|nr:hypothetical protein BGZ95_009321 [Linnemannia exigua]
MRLFSSNKPSDNSSSRKTLSIWTLISVLVLLSAFLASNTSSSASAAPASGFCAECQTYAYVVQPCGGTFTADTIMIDGNYEPPQSVANCVCKAVIQRLLWNCAKCIQFSGKMVKTPPPTQYQTTCMKTWQIPVTTWESSYVGMVAPGTTSPLTKDGSVDPNPNPVGPGLPTGGPNPSTTTGSGNNNNNNNNGGTGTSSGTSPTNSDGSTSGNGESTGPNGTAIGISLGIIGVAAVAGGVAVVMMKRRRRRHTPLELDGTYVGLEDQWEKPARPQTPPMMPAPIANGGRGGGGGMRPSPFESRPPGSVSGGGSVVGGYDNSQYDQYDNYHQGGGSTVVGSNYGDYDDGYGGKQQQHGGYNQGYNQGYPPHDQGYPPHHDQGGYGHGHGHDYGYDHPVPTGAPYHGGR